jgi:hypothetical protein
MEASTTLTSSTYNYPPQTPIVPAALSSPHISSPSTGDMKLYIAKAPVSEALLVFNDVNYEVSLGKKKPPRQLLKAVSGYVKSGQILAIMGPSGMFFHPSFTSLSFSLLLNT